MFGLRGFLTFMNFLYVGIVFGLCSVLFLSKFPNIGVVSFTSFATFRDKHVEFRHNAVNVAFQI